MGSDTSATVGGIVFPIFISEPNSVYAYDSIADAQLDLETVDVEGGVYSGYDSEGRRLVLQASGVQRGRFGSVDQSRATFTISPGEVEPTHSEPLRRILINFLSAVETEKLPLESLSLPELERLALPYARSR
jgi:hypothetical protein